MAVSRNLASCSRHVRVRMRRGIFTRCQTVFTVIYTKAASSNNASHTITQISTFDFSPPPPPPLLTACRESEPALVSHHISIVPGVSESARCSHQRWTRGHAADQSDDSRAEGELELLLRADRRARVRLPACPLQTFTVT